MSPTVADVIAVLEAAYPPALAADWDAVGLVCGDPTEPVRSVVFAVDPVPATVAEAADAQLLVTHHPLLLRGVHGVGADTPKGALLHRLIRSGTALFTAHTNADAADPGVSDALAAAIGVEVRGPLIPAPAAAAGQDRHLHPGRPGDLRRARRAVGGRRRPHRRLQRLFLRHRRHRPVPAAGRCDTRPSGMSVGWSGWPRRSWR